jgi:cytochrome P450
VIDLFSVRMRRDPYPAYDLVRAASPVFHLAPFDLWMIFDFERVKRVLVDHDVFSSDLSIAPGHKNPGEWFIFFDPPRHTKLRAIIAKAFTPRVVANLEPRIRELSRAILDETIERGEMDLVADFSAPLPMRVIAELLGVPAADWPRYRDWSDVILKLANTFTGRPGCRSASPRPGAPGRRADGDGLPDSGVGNRRPFAPIRGRFRITS